MPTRPSPTSRLRRLGGFTLIELMIAVVVAGVLASLAMPAFFDTVRKSRRSEAFAALMAAQQAQERWRANNAAYSTDLSGDLRQPTSTGGGRYTLAVVAADATSYTLRATAGGSQEADTRCARLLLRATAGAVQYGSACATCAVPEPLTDAARCWSRE